MAVKKNGPDGDDIVIGASSVALDQIISLDDLWQLKNSRSGCLSVVTVKRNEIQVLLSSKGDASSIKEKCQNLSLHCCFPGSSCCICT